MPGTETITESGTVEAVEVEAPLLSHGDGDDHDRFSHYVPKRLLADAIINGSAVRALCGKLWVPGRDPNRFPLCTECKEKWEAKDDSPRPPDADA